MLWREIAVTTQELADTTFDKRKRKLSTKQIRETYLEQLINEGYIDSEKSELNRSAHIYFPVISTRPEEEQVTKTAVFGLTPLRSHTSKIIVENPAIYLTKEYVISQIEGLLREAFQDEFMRVGENADPNDISDIKELAEKYYNNPEEYFELKKEEKNNSVESHTENATSQNTEIASESQEIRENNIENLTSKKEKCKTSNVGEKPAMFATSSVTYYQFQCYHCYERQTDNYNYQTNSEKEYDRHLDTEHPGKPAYPNKTRLEEFGLTPQGRTWEF